MAAFHEHFAQVGDVQLRWNVVGVGNDGKVDPERFSVRLFAVDFAQGKGRFDAPLSAEEIRKLHAFLTPFVEQLPGDELSPEIRIIEAESGTSEVIDLLVGLDKAGLKRILSALHERGRFQWLAENLGRVESEELEAALRHARRRKAIEKLKTLVEEDGKGNVVAICKESAELTPCSAGKPETVFQRWFEENTWVLGREYIRRHPLRVIGLDSEADLVMETTDGFLDLIELKRPSARLLACKQLGQSGAVLHYPHSDLSEAYGQCVRYMADLEAFRLQLERKYNARIVAPRVFLIAGRSPDGEDGSMDALRRICASFHQIEVLSYDQVIDLGEALLSRGSGEAAGSG